jgi:hypothetical protein
MIDDLIIILHDRRVDRLDEGPCRLVILQVVQYELQNAVVRITTGLP